MPRGERQIVLRRHQEAQGAVVVQAGVQVVGTGAGDDVFQNAVAEDQPQELPVEKAIRQAVMNTSTGTTRLGRCAAVMAEM